MLRISRTRAVLFFDVAQLIFKLLNADDCDLRLWPLFKGQEASSSFALKFVGLAVFETKVEKKFVSFVCNNEVLEDRERNCGHVYCVSNHIQNVLTWNI